MNTCPAATTATAVLLAALFACQAVAEEPAFGGLAIGSLPSDDTPSASEDPGSAGMNESRIDAMARIGEAIRYSEQCDGLSLDRDRAFQVATAVGLPSSSIVAAHAESSSSMITAPIIGLPAPPRLAEEECARGFDLYGPEGRLLPGLLVRTAGE